MAEKNYLLLLLVLMLGCQATGFLHNLKEGEECYMNNKKPGVCTRIRSCRGAIKKIRNHEMKLKLCSYDKEPIICCENMKHRTFERITAEPLTASQQNSYRIADEKCKEYVEYSYVTRELEILLPTREFYREQLCVKSGQELIVGGEKAESGEFPHMVALGFPVRSNTSNEFADGTNTSKIAWKCGGSLISEQFVLTAAHCKSSERIQVKFARLGSLYLQKWIDNERSEPQTLQVIDFIRHESYKSPSVYHDIALAKLEKPVKLGPFVRPACLHTDLAELMKIKYLTATGWGLTNPNNGEVSDSLMKVSLELFSQEKCQMGYPLWAPHLTQGIDESSMICAGDPKGVKDTCKGDSGGPIQYPRTSSNCIFNIVAVTSFGSSNCVSNKQPGLYTRVHYYVPWIQRHVWPYNGHESRNTSISPEAG